MRGHVRKRGKTWCFVLDIGRDENGTRKQKWFSGFATRKAAERAMATVLVQLDSGPFVEPNKQTVSEYLAVSWLPAIPSTVRPSTYESYARNLRLHVVPYIGTVQLRRLDAGHLNALYAQLLASGRVSGSGSGEGLSPRTVHYIHTILHRALRDAMRWGKVTCNVAEAADPPRASTYRSHDLPTWSATQVRAFLHGVRDERLWTLWLLLSSTGMRRGEALGLRWAATDLDGATVQIIRTLVTVGDEIQWSTPKTARGRRLVALDGVTVAALRSHRARQAQERLALGELYVDGDLIFAKVTGEPLHPKAVTKEFQTRAKRLGLPVIRLHGLRHSYATLALQAGVQTKIVSERIGHASTSITADTYQHVTPGMQSDAAEAVAKLLFGGVDS